MSSTHFRPMPGKVVVEVVTTGERTHGNIILPAPARDEPTLGRVIAVPEEAIVDGQEIAPFVQVGDYVIFGKYAGTELRVSGDRNRKIVAMREVDILTIVEDIPSVTEPQPRGDVEDVVGAEPETLRGEVIG